MNNKKKIKISIAINLIITLLTIIASIMMFNGIKYSDNTLFETTKIGMFKFFTVDSNIFMGIVALLFSIQEINLLKNKEYDISPFIYYLKFMATAAVSLTFFVVFTYLGPISKGGIISMLQNSNLFFHLIIPILSIITFVFFEKNNHIPFNKTILGLIPVFIYAIYYIINILVHMENGKVSYIYDWYLFVQNGVWTAIIVVPMIFLITYIIGLLLRKFNEEK